MFSTAAQQPSSPPNLSLFPAYDTKGNPLDGKREIRWKKNDLYVHSGIPSRFTSTTARRNEQVDGMVALLKGFEGTLRSKVGTVEKNDATIRTLRQRAAECLRLPAASVVTVDRDSVRTVMASADDKARIMHVRLLRDYADELASLRTKMKTPDALTAQAVLNHKKSRPASDVAVCSNDFLVAVADRSTARVSVEVAWNLELASRVPAGPAHTAMRAARDVSLPSRVVFHPNAWPLNNSPVDGSLVPVAVQLHTAPSARAERPVRRPPPVAAKTSAGLQQAGSIADTDVVAVERRKGEIRTQLKLFGVPKAHLEQLVDVVSALGVRGSELMAHVNKNYAPAFMHAPGCRAIELTAGYMKQSIGDSAESAFMKNATPQQLKAYATLK